MYEFCHNQLEFFSSTTLFTHSIETSATEKKYILLIIITMVLKFQATIIFLILVVTSREKGQRSQDMRAVILRSRDSERTLDTWARDCPLQDMSVKTRELEMRVHVFRSKVPATVTLKMSLIYEKWDETHFVNLGIKEAGWSELSVKANDKEKIWKFSVSNKDEVKNFLTHFTSNYSVDYLELDIPSKDFKWYVGPKNVHCDVLLPTTVASPTTQGVTSGHFPKEGKMNNQIEITIIPKFSK